jgi:hypothetical protein
VLHAEDPLLERVHGVRGHHRDGALRHDGAGVHAAVDEVDRRPGDAHAGVEGLLLRVEAGERGQEGRVDVEDAPGEGVEQHRRHEAHEARHADPLDAVCAEEVDQGGVVGLPGLSLARREPLRGDAGGAGALEAVGVALVRHDQGHTETRGRTRGVDQRLQVRAGAADQHRDRDGHTITASFVSSSTTSPST